MFLPLEECGINCEVFLPKTQALDLTTNLQEVQAIENHVK